MRHAAVFPAASSGGVARSPRVGVSSQHTPVRKGGEQAGRAHKHAPTHSNPNQEVQGTTRDGRTGTHPPQHPPKEWRGAAENPNPSTHAQTAHRNRKRRGAGGPPCGFRWLVGVRWRDQYGVRFLLRRCVLGVCVPRSRAAFAGDGAALVLPSWYALPGCGSWRLPWCPLPLCLGPRSCPFLVLGWFPAPTLCLFRCPVPMGACPSLGAPPCPPA